MTSTRRRRRSVAVLIGPALLAGTLLAPAGTPAQAAPSTAASDPGYHLGLTDRQYTITLLTGDRVILTGTEGGRHGVDMRPAARPDGSRPSFDVTNGGRSDALYVVPDDALPLLSRGLLDWELFNVAYLAANGYADDAGGSFGGQVPVIIEYADGTGAATASRHADGLPASTRTTTLETIDAAGVSVAKPEAAAFWQSLSAGQSGAGARTAALPGGIERILLDQRVRVDLDQSVARIGAPQAWAAGFDGTGTTVCVVDTGIDAGHPDLAGKVVAGKSFVPGEDEKDRHGHGTHVASTVAGTGAASGGRYTGVAKGAMLANAKALDAAGFGATSWIIDGMEWCAAEQRADVVSMSLGGGQTDGTDPMSRAVDDLTAATGALFVIAAGNAGPSAFRVTAPGAATSALTVGAVDKADRLAEFSSRGPRLGDFAVKPEISGPGVDIVAARATGTALGTPVDDRYTRLSGTSMATPHVSGAAAILAQQHAEWGPERLKAGLVASAADTGGTAFEQGAGRVDIARVVAQPVTAGPAALNFGRMTSDRQPATTSATVTYTNPTAEAVTLDLKLTGTADGKPLPDGALSVEPSTVIIPAGANASATVTASVTGAPHGLYAARLVATGAGDLRLTTPIGYGIAQPDHTISVTVTPRDAADSLAFQCEILYLAGLDGAGLPLNVWKRSRGECAAEFQVPAGIYHVNAQVIWIDRVTGQEQTGFLANPEVVVDGPTEVTLAAAAAQKITVATPRPTEALQTSIHYRRLGADGGFFSAHKRWGGVWATPTGQVSSGSVDFSTRALLAAPLVTMETVGRDRINLHATYVRPDIENYPGWENYNVRFSGRRTLGLVDAGTGTAQELARVNARGKLVMLHHDSSTGPGWGGCWPHQEVVDRVVAAGAAGVVYTPDAAQVTTCPVPGNGGWVQRWPPVPMVAIPYAAAEALRARLARSEVKVRVDGTPVTPYLYNVRFRDDGRIGPAHRTVTDHDLATIDHRVHAAAPAEAIMRTMAFQPDERVVVYLRYEHMQTPRALTEYVGPVDNKVIVDHVIERFPDEQFMQFRRDVFDRSSRATWAWFDGPPLPGTMLLPESSHVDIPPADCVGCRQGDTFYPLLHYSESSDPHQSAAISGWFGAYADDPELHLFRGGAEVPRTAGPPGLPVLTSYVLPPERDRYRLTHRVGGTGPADRSVATEWEFTSGPVERNQVSDDYWCPETTVSGSTTPCRPEPLIFLRYDFGTDLSNRIAAPGIHKFRINTYRQPATARSAKVTDLNLWISTDGGATWKREWFVRSLGGGRFEATVGYPPVNRTGGTVSVRVEARDAEGNRVAQTVRNAFTLRAR